ncbi:MAG: hypothetical protein AAFX85_07670, partial [Pseudomonadota bacterium]
MATSTASTTADQARTWLASLLEGVDLDEGEASDLLTHLASGDLPSALAGALLVALRAKGESAAEIRGFAKAMRGLAVAPPLDATGAVDIVGTGGDGHTSPGATRPFGLATVAPSNGVRNSWSH